MRESEIIRREVNRTILRRLSCLQVPEWLEQVQSLSCKPLYMEALIMATSVLIISKDKKLVDQIEHVMGADTHCFCVSPTFLDGLDHLVSEDFEITFIERTPPWEDAISSLFLIRWISDTRLVAMMPPGNNCDKAHILDVADELIWLPLSKKEVHLLKRQGTNRRYSPLLSHKQRAYFYNRGLLVFPMQQRVFFGDEEISLSIIEYEILSFLILNRDSIVSREQILAGAWQNRAIAENEKTVSVHIHSIRSKLRKVTERQYIETVRGFGYKFVTEVRNPRKRSRMGKPTEMAS